MIHRVGVFCGLVRKSGWEVGIGLQVNPAAIRHKGMKLRGLGPLALGRWVPRIGQCQNLPWELVDTAGGGDRGWEC
jgi:hypothetical protein